MACAVKVCKNLKRFKPHGISFFQFPRDEKMIKKWYAVLNIEKPLKWATNQKFVCSKHFPKSATTHAGRLKFNAVPTLKLTAEEASESEDNCESETDFIIDINVGEQSVNEGSDQSSPHSSLKRKRSNIIVQSDSSSPDILIKTLHSVILERDRTRAKLYKANQTIKELKTQFLNLSQTQTSLINEEEEDVPHLLMKRYTKNVQLGSVSKDTYPEKLLQFAETLHSCSPKAYNLVRSVFSQALPQQPSSAAALKKLEN